MHITKNRKSPRHPSYDYRSTSWYFITINTGNRRHYFGKVTNGEIALSALGKLCRKIETQSLTILITWRLMNSLLCQIISMELSS